MAQAMLVVEWIAIPEQEGWWDLRQVQISIVGIVDEDHGRRLGGGGVEMSSGTRWYVAGEGWEPVVDNTRLQSVRLRAVVEGRPVAEALLPLPRPAMTGAGAIDDGALHVGFRFVPVATPLLGPTVLQPSRQPSDGEMHEATVEQPPVASVCLLNDTPVGGVTLRAAPGSAIGLVCRLNVDVPATYRWRIEGPAVGGYDVTTGAPVAPVDLDGQGFRAYWLSHGVFAITCVALVGSVEIAATPVTLMVYPVLCELSARSSGHVQLYTIEHDRGVYTGVRVGVHRPPDIPELLFFEGPSTTATAVSVRADNEEEIEIRDDTSGAELAANVVVASQLEGVTGQWCFLQLVREKLWRDFVDLENQFELGEGAPVRMKTETPEWCMDGEFPYDELHEAPAATSASDDVRLSPDEDEGEVKFASDLPDIAVFETDGMILREMHFRMLVMFRPSADDAIWVPVELVRWGVRFRVERRMGPPRFELLLDPFDILPPPDAELTEQWGRTYRTPSTRTTCVPTWRHRIRDLPDAWRRVERVLL